MLPASETLTILCSKIGEIIQERLGRISTQVMHGRKTANNRRGCNNEC